MPRLVETPHKIKHARKAYNKIEFRPVIGDNDSAKNAESGRKKITVHQVDHFHHPKADVFTSGPRSLSPVTRKGDDDNDTIDHVNFEGCPPVLQEKSFQQQNKNVFPWDENIVHPVKPQERRKRNVSEDIHMCSNGKHKKPDSVISVSTGAIASSRERKISQRSLIAIAENCCTTLTGSCVKNANISEMVKECHHFLGSKPKATTIRDIVFELANQLGVPTVETNKEDVYNVNKSNPDSINTAVIEELDSISNKTRPISNEALFRLQIHFHRKNILKFQFQKEEKLKSKKENETKQEKDHLLLDSNRGEMKQEKIGKRCMRNIAFHNHDVIMGREKIARNSPGNLHFLGVVTEYRHQYCFAKRKEKKFITKLIVQRIRSLSPPGRFIKYEPGTGLWHDVGEDMAMEKARQALRLGKNEHSV